MATNDFLPFAPTDTGTNLLTQGQYAVATDRTNGNQPGVASSKLVNKAARQSAYITSQVAQFVSDITGTNVLDDATPAKLLAQINASLARLPMIVTSYTSGSGTHNRSNVFFIATGSATAGATYTNNGFTFTVAATVASGVQIRMTGTGEPSLSGTLTKSAGTGDATLTFYAVRVPTSFNVVGVGGGGGGAGSGTASWGAGAAGGNTTFGSSLLVANGGSGASGGGNVGAAGGTGSLGSGPTGKAGSGGSGTAGSSLVAFAAGGTGGTSIWSGAGGGGNANGAGIAAATNSGSGGGGGGNGTGASQTSGPGGGAGGFFDAIINSPSATYSYAVGALGAGGTAGTSGFVGGSGAAGGLTVYEVF